MFWHALGDVQLAILAALLLSASLAKVVRVLRGGSLEAALGPTALFPLRLRRPVAIAMCAVELGLGAGLILTAGDLGTGTPAKLIRIGTALLFVVATCALIELRSVRPDVGCGCFGEFSMAPVDDRTVTRSALLAIAAMETARLPPVDMPRSPGSWLLLALLFTAELGLLATMSPELREALVRLGYSAPCELTTVSPERTLESLRKSVPWRRQADLITDGRPSDMWRELCWRYVAFPARYAGRDAELVFAVYLQSRRAAVRSVLVDAVTGAVVPWPADPDRSRPARRQRPAVPVPRLDALRELPDARHA
jgi:hypothetical protein